MLLSNAFRSLFKHIKATEGRGRETTEYSSVSTESEGHHGVEENANNKIKSQIKKAMEAERLQDYLERIVQRIDDLEKHFAWKAKGKLVSDDPANGDNDATGGDYRRDQARDRLLRLQQEAKNVKNRINLLKYQLYCEL